MLEVDEDNFVDRLTNFAIWNYGDALDEMTKNYPYRALFDIEEHAKQMSLWAACKVVNPATGITILDEFVDRFVHGSRLRSKILLLKEMVYDLFMLLEYRGGLITAASLNGRGIIILEVEEDIAKNLTSGLEFEGLVYPWDIGKTYKMAGSVSVTDIGLNLNSELDMTGSMLEDSSPGISLLQILQKYSILDLEYTCDLLGIDPSGKRHSQLAQEIFEALTTDRVHGILKRLTPPALDCLTYIACSGGLAEYRDLHERFGDGLENILDELVSVCLVIQISYNQDCPTSDTAYVAPDLLAAMYRLGCLGLKRWHP